VYFDRTWNIMTVVIISAAMWMKSVAVQVNLWWKGMDTCLEDEGVREFNVPCITYWFEAILPAHERA